MNSALVPLHPLPSLLPLPPHLLPNSPQLRAVVEASPPLFPIFSSQPSLLVPSFRKPGKSFACVLLVPLLCRPLVSEKGLNSILIYFMVVFRILLGHEDWASDSFSKSQPSSSSSRTATFSFSNLLLQSSTCRSLDNVRLVILVKGVTKRKKHRITFSPK